MAASCVVFLSLALLRAKAKSSAMQFASSMAICILMMGEGAAASPCDVSTLQIRTGGYGDENSWSIRVRGGTQDLCTGSGYYSHWQYTENCCLTFGVAYTLKCMDSGWDGWREGAYVEIGTVQYCNSFTNGKEQSHTFTLTASLADHTLQKQSDVDSLKADLAAQNQSELEATLVITGDVHDLRPLRGHLRRLSGALVIQYATRLRNLDGLDSLEAVGTTRDGTSIIILTCQQLVSLAGLAGLQGSLPGSLQIIDSRSLRNLSGLDRITSLGRSNVGHSIFLKTLDRLQSMAGLSGLAGTIPGKLVLQRNMGLEDVDDLSGVTSLAGVVLQENPSLWSIRGLRGLRGPVDELNVDGNSALASLDGLEGISAVKDGDLVLTGNSALLSVKGLRGVSGPLPGRLTIKDNLKLQDLSGLEGLTRVFHLEVTNNAALRSVASLGGLAGVSHKISVDKNQALRSLHGLEQVNSTYSVSIMGNPALRTVAALGGLHAVSYRVSMSNNVQLQSFQGLLGLPPPRLTITWQGLVECLTPEESNRTVQGRDGVLSNFPSDKCHRCPHSCGDGPYECAYDIGQCRCPLQRTGPGCADSASLVHVQLPSQQLHCGRPSRGGHHAAEPCELRVPLRRDHAVNGSGGGATNIVLELLGGDEVQGLNVSESRVEWENETHGSIVAIASVPFGSTYFQADADVSLHAGYGHVGQPDCLLNGTVAGSRSPNLPVYPWCLDGGTCSRFVPLEIPLFIKGREASCPPWFYSEHNHDGCIPCPLGAIAAKKVIHPGEEACQSCGWMQVPRKGYDQCGLPMGFFALLLAATCTLTAGLSLAFAQLEVVAGLHIQGRSIPIEDISCEGGRVVLSTCGPHNLHKWFSQAIRVTIRGTGQPRLDEADKPLRAQVLGKDRLLLLDADKAPLQGRFDTSMGSIHLEPQGVAVHAGRRLPVSLTAPLLVSLGVVGLIEAVQLRESTDELDAGTLALAVAAPLAALLAALLGRVWVQRQPRQNQLQKRVALYAEHVLQEVPEPRRRDRGPGRAIRAEQLLGLLDFFRAFIRDRNMHYVVQHIVKPLTAEKAVSFAEFVGPSEVRWFVSHFWGTAFADFCASIQKHAEAVGGMDWQVERYWICSFSNNQHRVPEEMGDDLNSSSFYLALCSGCCRGTCMVLDENVMPLKRSWCLFELLQTIRMEAEGAAGFEGLLFCTEAGVLNYGTGTLARSMKVAGVLAELSLENATASDPCDKAMIDAQVVGTMGGFEAMDAALRTRVEAVVGVAETSATAEFVRLKKRLRGEAD